MAPERYKGGGDKHEYSNDFWREVGVFFDDAAELFRVKKTPAAGAQREPLTEQERQAF